jgi:membrane protease YdiL (CAAX protease family)
MTIDPAADFQFALVIGALALFVLWVASRRGFFHIGEAPLWKVPVRFTHVAAAFLLYFAIGLFAAPKIYGALRSLQMPMVAELGWLNFLNTCLILGAVLLVVTLPQPLLLRAIWREKGEHLLDDIKSGIVAWLVAFPTVIALSLILELLLFYGLNVRQIPDQVAVYFLKLTFASPFFFGLALTVIVVLAPVVEELLFRGLLQSYIRQTLGPKGAIGLTSLCFSFFHYTTSQGFSNIPIIGSLFVLSLFIGLIYEKQRSLAAPIALHGLFNAVSALNLYLMGRL